MIAASKARVAASPVFAWGNTVTLRSQNITHLLIEIRRIVFASCVPSKTGFPVVCALKGVVLQILGMSKKNLWLPALFVSICALSGQNLAPFEPVPLAQIRDRHVSSLGERALAIRPGDWLHAETKNFVYHFFARHIAASASVEAEFYYRFVSAEMAKENANWERKAHIFIFEQKEDWQQFQKTAQLDPWTGGIHSRNELFIYRPEEFRWKGPLLGHEVTHLVVDRFFGSNVPLWLNEGYAEYASTRAYASYYRARGYVARPRSRGVTSAEMIAMDRFLNLQAYPAEIREVDVFYRQAERLVRFLSSTNKQGFMEFFTLLAQGSHFDTAMRRSFGTRFLSLNELDREFTAYAVKDREED